MKILPLSVKSLSEGTCFKFSSSIAIVWSGGLWGRQWYHTQALGHYVCAVIKKEKMMPLNPELGSLTICKNNTEEWFTFQNVSFIALPPVFPSCLSLNSKWGHQRSKGHRFEGQVEIWDVSSKIAIYHIIFTLEPHFNVFRIDDTKYVCSIQWQLTSKNCIWLVWMNKGLKAHWHTKAI